VIASVHLADVGPRRALSVVRGGLDPAAVDGLVYADTHVGAHLGAGLLPRPRPGRAGLVAFWEDDAALDAFLATHALARTLAPGFHLRLEPLRASGSWTGLPPLVDAERPVDDEEPVAVLTYGRLRKRRALPFLRASAVAEADALAAPAMLAGTGLASPPHVVATFSLWRTAREMREYAYRGHGHTAALHAVAQDDFHHESLFARFRPYAAAGTWDGVALPTAAAAVAA